MKSERSFAEYSSRLREYINASDRSETGFNQLALALFALQYAHVESYRRFCLGRRVLPDKIICWTEIPAVPTAVFKELEMTSLPVGKRAAVFHSSGTMEQRPSRHYHSVESQAIYEASLLPWFKAHVIPDAERCTFVILTPAPVLASHSSLVHMFQVVRRAFGSPDSLFTGGMNVDGGWTLDFDATLRALQKATETSRPATLLGTAFSFVHLLDELAAKDLRLELPPGSRALETGGYKGRSRSLPRDDLHALITDRLGIPASHIVCEYGMCELSSQAYDRQVRKSEGVARDEARVFRFPPWARARIVSPENGRETAEGETGLIQVYDLANVRSVMAIQTEDLAVRRGEGFELIGRAASAEPRGCSLMAG